MFFFEFIEDQKRKKTDFLAQKQKKKGKNSRKDNNNVPHQELNPGPLGEGQVSYPLHHENLHRTVHLKTSCNANPT